MQSVWCILYHMVQNMPKPIAIEGQNNQEDATYLPYLPDHLKQRYVDGLHDAELTHLRRQIALSDVRIKLLLEALDRQVLTEKAMVANLLDEFPDLEPDLARQLAKYLLTFLPEGFIDSRTFRSLERLMERYNVAIADGRLIQAYEALGQLDSAIRHGRRDGDVWKEIEEVMDSRRKLVEAEQRRVQATQESLTVERAVKMIGAVIESLREAVIRHVPDRNLQSSILGEAQLIYQSRLLGTVDIRSDESRLD